MIEKITWVVFWVPLSFCILTRHRVCFGDNGCLNSMAHLCPSQTSVCSAGCIPQSPWCDSVTQKCQVVRSTVQPSLVPAHMPWGVWVWAGGWTILLAQQKHHRISQEGFSLSLSLIIKRKLVIIWSFFFFLMFTHGMPISSQQGLSSYAFISWLMLKGYQSESV